ncbi:MAG: periplasmic protein TonB [Methylobacteriaceae bacterium]|jgi:protein TonB|nr:periplasmic protein TonB [Methylobacteriaceae bacterium]
MQAKRAFEPAAPLVADERLRLLPRVAARSISPRARVAVVAATLFVHAALIAFILYRDGSERFDVQPEQEIPVEVVAEVPQPPAPQPEPKPQEDYDKPAYSAPRAPSAVATDQTGVQDKTEAPQVQSKAQDGAPAPANKADPAPQPVTSALRGTAEERIANDKAEPFEAASPLPDKSLGQALPTAKSQNTAETDVLRQLSFAQPAFSNFSFAASTKLAPLTGGTEDNRFMANVFAKILSKKRYPQSAASRRASGTVMVSFIIDGEGGLVYQTISHSSGEPDIDAEAIAAVKAAAPYPPPPPGAPRTLLATLKF